MREYKAIYGIYGKHNNLIGCYEDHIRALTTYKAKKLALETQKFLKEEHQRQFKLVSLRVQIRQEQQSNLPF